MRLELGPQKCEGQEGLLEDVFQFEPDTSMSGQGLRVSTAETKDS